MEINQIENIVRHGEEAIEVSRDRLVVDPDVWVSMDTKKRLAAMEKAADDYDLFLRRFEKVMETVLAAANAILREDSNGEGSSEKADWLNQANALIHRGRAVMEARVSIILHIDANEEVAHLLKRRRMADEDRREAEAHAKRMGYH